jgi:hypothetical protein
MLAQLTASTSLPNTLSTAFLMVLLPKGKLLPRELPHQLIAGRSA